MKLLCLFCKKISTQIGFYSKETLQGHLGHRNWQIETAVWNLAGFLHCALETHWQRCGQFLNDFLNGFLNDFLYENLFSFKILFFSVKIPIFSMKIIDFLYEKSS